MKIAKRVLSTSLLLCTVSILGLIFPSDSWNQASAEVVLTPKIILDAGHGGWDGGAVASDGTVEKNINLKICLKLSDFLKASGYQVILTRESDVSTDTPKNNQNKFNKKSDLENRLKLMHDNPDAIFVSVHLNKFTTSAASGSQIFYSKQTENSKILGECIREKIVNLLQPDNTRINKQATSSTFLLHRATVPAVLVECGFLSNSGELKLLKTEEYQNEIAFCIFCGINDYFINTKESKQYGI